MAARGRGKHRDAASTWRLQQQLQVLKAACLSSSSHDSLPMQVTTFLSKVFAFLAQDDNACDPEGAQQSADGAVAMAATNIQMFLQQHAETAQLVTSLVHALLFLTWVKPQCVNTCSSSIGSITSVCNQAAGDSITEVSGSSNTTDHISSGNGISSGQASQSASTAQPIPRTTGNWDPWGKAAAWHLTDRQYAHLVHALKMHALVLDMLAWLPDSRQGYQLQQQLQQTLIVRLVVANPPLLPPLLGLTSPQVYLCLNTQGSLAATQTNHATGWTTSRTTAEAKELPQTQIPPTAASAVQAGSYSGSAEQTNLAGSSNCNLVGAQQQAVGSALAMEFVTGIPPVWQPRPIWALLMFSLQSTCSSSMLAAGLSVQITCLCEVAHAVLWWFQHMKQWAASEESTLPESKPKSEDTGMIQVSRQALTVLQQYERQQQAPVAGMQQDLHSDIIQQKTPGHDHSLKHDNMAGLVEAADSGTASANATTIASDGNGSQHTYDNFKVLQPTATTSAKQASADWRYFSSGQLATTSMQLLEQLLACWQDFLMQSSSASSSNDAWSQVLLVLQQVQQQCQHYITKLASSNKPAASAQPVLQHVQADAPQLQQYVHLNARVTLFLMAAAAVSNSKPGESRHMVTSADAPAGVTVVRNSMQASRHEQSQPVADSWQTLRAMPFQYKWIPGVSSLSAWWSTLQQSSSVYGVARTTTPQSSFLSTVLAAAQRHRTFNSLDTKVLATSAALRCPLSCSSACSTVPADCGSPAGGTQPASRSLEILPKWPAARPWMQHGVDSVADHIAALVLAWLTPGAVCWWARVAPTVVHLAGPDVYHPANMTAVLLDMLLHCQRQCQLQGCDVDADAVAGSQQFLNGWGELSFMPGLPHVLVSMLGAVAAQVVDRQQQLALLNAVYATTTGYDTQTQHSPVVGQCGLSSVSLGHGVDNAGSDGQGQASLQAHHTWPALEANQLFCSFQRLHEWLSSKVDMVASASRLLVSISNQMSARDDSGELVVLTKVQQADLIADMAKALLPCALLYPHHVISRLLMDGIHHRCGQVMVCDQVNPSYMMLISLGCLCLFTIWP